MCDIKVNMQFLEHAKDLQVPAYETLGSAGMDVRAAIIEDLVIKPSKRAVIPTGICVSIPQGYELQVRSRSGLAAKNGVCVLNAPGTIDCDYRGEIKVILMNLGDEDFIVKRGDRVAQLVFSRCFQADLNVVDSLDDTSRGSNGFGSTGIK